MASKPPANLPLSAPGGNQADNKPTPTSGGSFSKPPSPGPKDSVPLAPKSFKDPKSKKGGGGRKIAAVVFGSLIVLFLIGAIGLFVFQLFSSGGEEDQVADSGNNQDPTVAERPAERPVDLGPWTTPPPCVDFKKENAWVLDADQDHLTNAEERLFGTDPCNKDTNADGISDGDSVRAGQNPSGTGRLDFAKYGLPDPEASN